MKLTEIPMITTLKSIKNASAETQTAFKQKSLEWSDFLMTNNKYSLSEPIIRK